MKKILLVTGNPGTIKSWRKKASDGGLELDYAISASEAFERAVSGSPDAIILEKTETRNDVFIERLKNHSSTSQIPIIEISGGKDIDGILEKIGRLFSLKRVLIAEDDRQMSDILKAVLQKSGHEVKQAYDGVEALKEVKSWKPHLLVLDIMLPVLDGFHICQAISDDASLEARPRILIISGRSTEWDQKLGAACGAEEYLVKPFNNSVFLTKVREILAE